MFDSADNITNAMVAVMFSNDIIMTVVSQILTAQYIYRIAVFDVLLENKPYY